MCFEPDLDPKNSPEGPKKVQKRPKMWWNQKEKSAAGLHWVGTYIKRHPWLAPTTNNFAVLSLGLLGYFLNILGHI